MKILITGSTGQLSQALQTALAGDGKVFAMGHSTLDLAEPRQIRQQVRALNPDVIINAAAYTAVDAAQDNRHQAYAVNAVGPGVLAEEAATLGVPLVHYSTDYVFSGDKSEPYVEEDKPAPLSVYGQSKLAGEQAIQAVGGQHLILRTSWVYSRDGRNFLLTMQRLLQERDTLSVVDNEIGAPTWAGTIASVTAEMVRKWANGTGGPSGLYHLTATGQTSWYGFACSIAEQLRHEGRLRAVLTPIQADDYPTTAQRPLNSRLNCARLQREWNIQLPEWRAALQQCLGETADNAMQQNFQAARSG